MQPGWRFAAAHAVLAVAIWLFGVVVYAVACGEPRTLWLAVDCVLILAALAALRRQPLPWLVIGAAVAIATACVIASQLRVPATAGIWIDESNYLRTLREGTIVRDATAPFNLRWLAPFLAGAWNVTPLVDTAALAAVNAGALVVTATYTVLLLLRLNVTRAVAFAAPVFLVCSYLGVYAATNRLVVDPFNYAAYVVIFHLLVRKSHWRFLPVALLVAAFNSEKVIYWIPVIAVVVRLRGESWRAVAVTTLRAAAPAVLYLAAIALYLRGSPTHATPLFAQNLEVMRITPLGGRITDPDVAANTFQTIWFPFGAFTIYTLLALPWLERWLVAVALLLVPIVGQTLIAYDTSRMVAYAFVVYLPLGSLYLTRALRGHVLLGILIALAIAQHYTLHARWFRQLLAAGELAAVAVVVLQARRSSRPDDGSSSQSPGSSDRGGRRAAAR
jgi:hypothetical protein